MSQCDKTNVPESQSILVRALVRNSTKVIAPNGTTVSVCDRDFTVEKFTPSVNCWMNIGTHIGELKMNVHIYIYCSY